uniref:Uncharacterized protein n=1 Tax=Rhizophora mucronata TaxID=61149 RepID=A0A2P2QPT3_RHIMU
MLLHICNPFMATISKNLTYLDPCQQEAQHHFG